MTADGRWRSKPTESVMGMLAIEESLDSLQVGNIDHSRATGDEPCMYIR